MTLVKRGAARDRPSTIDRIDTMNIRSRAVALAAVVIAGLAGCGPDVTIDEAKGVNAPPASGAATDATPAPSSDPNATEAQPSAGNDRQEGRQEAPPADDEGKGEGDKKAD